MALGDTADIHETLTPGHAGNPFVFSAGDTLDLWLFLRTDSLTVGNGWSTCDFLSGDCGAWLDNVQITPVPEPATLSLLVLGGVAMIRRRRNQAGCNDV